MKKRTFKKPIQRILEIIAILTFALFIGSVDSTWDLAYLKFIVIDILLFAVSGGLLKKYGDYEL